MLGRNSKLQKLYDIYGKEKVKEEIYKVEGKNKEILFMFFGLNGEGEATVETIANKFEVSNIAVYKTVNRILARIEEVLKYPHINRNAFLNSKNESLKKLYEKYSPELIVKALKTLDERDREIFCDYYGLNGQKIKKSSEIEKIYGIKKENVQHTMKRILKTIIVSITNSSNIRIGQKNSRLEKLYKTYGENAVRLAVDKLGEKSKNIMILYLGLDIEKPKSAKEIGELVGISENTINTMIWTNINKLDKILQNINDRPIIMERKKLEIIAKMFEKYGEYKIIECLDILKGLDRKVFEEYYGLNREAPKSYKQIAERYGMTDLEVIKTIRIASQCIHYVLDDIDNKERKLIAKYKRLTDKFTLKQIFDAVDLLKGDTRNVVSMYLGVDGIKESFKTIMEIYGIDSKKLYEMINKGLLSVDKMLDDMPTLLGSLYYKYGRKLVEEAIIRLSEDERKVIYEYKQKPSEILIDEFIKQMKNLEDEIKDLQEEAMQETEIVVKRRDLFKKMILIRDVEKLKRALDMLDDEEIELLEKYFPIKGENIHSISDLAKEMKYTNSKVREKLLKIINKINELMKVKVR